MKKAMLRSLHLAGATKGGEFCPAMMLKVRLARGHPGSKILMDMRTRWTSDMREDMGFILAVIALERDGAVELELHHKLPENIELAAIRLTAKATIPPKAEASFRRIPQQSRANSSQTVLNEQDVKVQCGDLDGILRPGVKRGDESIEFTDRDASRTSASGRV